MMHTDTSRSGDLVELREKLDRYSNVMGLTRDGAISRLLVLHDHCLDLICDNEKKADRIEALEAALRRFIIAKPDPLVEAIKEASQMAYLGDEHLAHNYRAAIERRGGKIVWGEG